MQQQQQQWWCDAASCRRPDSSCTDLLSSKIYIVQLVSRARRRGRRRMLRTHSLPVRLLGVGKFVTPPTTYSRERPSSKHCWWVHSEALPDACHCERPPIGQGSKGTAPAGCRRDHISSYYGPFVTPVAIALATANNLGFQARLVEPPLWILDSAIKAHPITATHIYRGIPQMVRQK